MKPYDRNTYFVLSLPEPALNAILAHCIESANTVRKNNDKNKAIVKLPIDAAIPPILLSKTPLTHDEIMAELENPEWNPTIP